MAGIPPKHTADGRKLKPAAAGDTAFNHKIRHSASRRGTEESPFVKWMLISIGLAFALVFLLLPLVNVFYQALAKGVGFYFRRYGSRIRGRPSGSRCWWRRSACR